MKKLRNTPKLMEKGGTDEAAGGISAKIEEREMELGDSEEERMMVKE
jgi:hypothetical protein